MNYVVRAVDVGFGNTKYISSVAAGDIRCASFPSVAYPTMREPSGQPGYERRKTVAIPINGLFYEVGPDVELAADTFRATQMHDRYTETSEYMALLRGALALMKLPSIDLLVVGLPVAALTMWAGGLDAAEALHRLAWLGVVPGTLALALGAALRRWLPQHLFVYILGRGFFATMVAAALAGALSLAVSGTPAGTAVDDLLLARWLAASGEAFLTGMLVAIFVAFRPQWLATYSDRLYLPLR